MTAQSWTRSATCSGIKSTESGVRNTSTATSATSTSCLHPSSIILFLSGGTMKVAEITHTPTQNLTTATTVGALPGRTTAPLCLSLQVTATPRRLSRLVTAAPLRLIRPTMGTPLTSPATVAPLRPSRCSKRALKMWNCREEDRTTGSMSQTQ